MALTERLTLDQFLRLPEAKPALEYARGVVSQKMSPKNKHGKLQGDLYFRFQMHGFHEHGRPQQVLSAFTETRVTWPDEDVSYVPDVIAYRVERVPVEPSGDVVDDFTVPPDIAVEIASPGQSLAAQLDRCRWYVAHGVAAALHVDPRQRSVWVFRPGTESGPLGGDDVVDLADVSPGLVFSVADLFAALRVRP